MTVFSSAARGAFHHDIWQRALIDGRNHWCKIANQEGGTVTLVPHDDEGERSIARWPALPEGVAQGTPGWIPAGDRIEAALGAIMRGERSLMTGHHGDNAARQQLHLAEQHVNAQELPLWICDRVLQVAVFGQVLFS
jgi:hypothetical protein